MLCLQGSYEDKTGRMSRWSVGDYYWFILNYNTPTLDWLWGTASVTTLQAGIRFLKTPLQKHEPFDFSWSWILPEYWFIQLHCEVNFLFYLCYLTVKPKYQADEVTEIFPKFYRGRCHDQPIAELPQKQDVFPVTPDNNWGKDKMKGCGAEDSSNNGPWTAGHLAKWNGEIPSKNCGFRHASTYFSSPGMPKKLSLQIERWIDDTNSIWNITNLRKILFRMLPLRGWHNIPWF